MNQLRIAGVTPAPIIRFDNVTIYSGYVGLERNRDFRGIVRATDLEPYSFFLPDSEPYTEAPPVLSIETSLRMIRTMGNPNLVFFGAVAAQVTVEPDPRGTGQSWLQVSFQSPTSSLELVEINYRVTVQG